MIIRQGRPEDMGELLALRTSVVENHLSLAEMAARGITPEGVLASMAAGDLCCFVVEDEEGIAGFSMSDRRDGQVFALFVRPGKEGRGHGGQLLAAALDWLAERGHHNAWLTTGPGTRAERFYRARGWQPDGMAEDGDVVLRLAAIPRSRPARSSGP